MHADNAVLNDLSGRVIGCAFTVPNTLGAGFLEKVYENALAIEMRAAGLGVVQPRGARVRYNNVVVGENIDIPRCPPVSRVAPPYRVRK
jgi:GxxExxY protein